MKKLLLLGLIFFTLSFNALAQERIITGKVFYGNNIPLRFVQVYQMHTNDFNYTDKYGVFHLVMNEKLEKNIILRHEGFTTKTITIDSANSYYTIELVADTTHILKEINNLEMYQSSYQKPRQSENLSLDFNLITDLMFNNFKSFEPLLGKENVNLLNNSGSNLLYELALNYNRFSYGISFGYCKYRDSTEILHLNLYNYQYAIRFGYNLLDSRHFRITPLVRLKWHIINLHNSDLGDGIPLEQYLTYKELDVKFEQLTGFVGCNFGYKSDLSLWGRYDRVGLGAFGGYIFQLNDKPWINSEEQILKSDKKIDIKKLNLGLYFTFYFDD